MPARQKGWSGCCFIYVITSYREKQNSCLSYPLKESVKTHREEKSGY